MRLVVLSLAAATLSSCAGLLAAPDDVFFVDQGIAPRYSARHYNWCARIRPAYRRSDNTFQRGRYKRYRCVSPYIDDPA